MSAPPTKNRLVKNPWEVLNPPDQVRSKGMRPLRLVGAGYIVWCLGQGFGNCGGCPKTGAICSLGDIPGRDRSSRVCGTASRQGKPSGHIWLLRSRRWKPSSNAGRGGGAGSAAHLDAARLGKGESNLPAGLYGQFYAGGHSGANGLVQRAAAGLGLAGERGPDHNRVLEPRRIGPPSQGIRANIGAPRS